MFIVFTTMRKVKLSSQIQGDAALLTDTRVHSNRQNQKTLFVKVAHYHLV